MLALKIFLAKVMPKYRVLQSEKSNMGDLKVTQSNQKITSTVTSFCTDVCDWTV